MHHAQGNEGKIAVLIRRYDADLSSQEKKALATLIQDLTKARDEKENKRKREETQRIKDLVLGYLRVFDFETADQAALKYRSRHALWYTSAREAQYKKYEQREETKETERKLEILLDISVTEADSAFKSQGLVDRETYQKIKNAWCKKYLEVEKKQKETPSNEQLTAISAVSGNFLLKARAGSGKTSVVASRVALLVDKEGLSSDKILTVAFNRKAARELQDRVKKRLGIPEFNTSKTFHGLAYQIAQPQESPLFDEKDGGVAEKARSSLVQSLVKSIENPVFHELLDKFFRKEIKELEGIGEFLTKRQYLEFRRAQRQVTLAGEKVKSIGEKYIADFLFEHSVRYSYERPWFWGDRLYRPDFTIFSGFESQTLVIEHWGIDEKSFRKTVPEHWARTWDEYFQEMQEKRKYWKDKQADNNRDSAVLIETSVADLIAGRSEFEKRLCSKLQSAGLTLIRMSDEEIADRVKRIHIARFTALIDQFISRAKKAELDPDAISAITLNIRDCERTRIFFEVSNGIYRQYQKALAERNLLDFDDLLQRACERIISSQGECSIRTGQRGSIKINGLRHVLVDEFQDFTLLFWNLLDAIKQVNPDIQFFCVGDDWQAINGFAGSDLVFFNHFDKYFENSNSLNLLRNFRSARSIVEISNEFMNGQGKPSRPTKDHGGGAYSIDVSKIFIEQRPDATHLEAKARDKKYFTLIKDKDGQLRNLDSGATIAKMLKCCNWIVGRAKKKGKSVAILSRVSQLNSYYRSLTSLKEKLISTFENAAARQYVTDRVHIGTIHSYKGLEADVVVILDVNEGKFPLIHPDSSLFYPLGLSGQEVLDEEQRLFYVAITRASSDLYLLYEEGRKSEYFSRIRSQLTEIVPRVAKI